jgi:Peptidase A4 family
MGRSSEWVGKRLARRGSLPLTAGLACFGMIMPGALTASPAASVATPLIVHGPARTGAHSDQTWSGYAVTAAGPYASITGSWNIPTMKCSHGGGDASPWIGIDGWSDSTVEQIGIDLDCVSGVASYHPWVEMYPGPSDYFKDTVHAGDTLTASVSVSGKSWVLTESDLNTGWTKTFHETSADKLSSAEAIIEDIGNSGAPPVPDFQTVKFTNITVNGKPLASAGTVHKTTLQRGSTKLSKESTLSGGNFSITWLHR